MSGDYQARFCEGLGVKFPLPTRRVPRGIHWGTEARRSVVPMYEAIVKMVGGPPIGAIRSTYQTALRCFCLRAEVLNGQGKGPGRRDQVDMQELSGSEPTDEVSKIT